MPHAIRKVSIDALDALVPLYDAFIEQQLELAPHLPRNADFVTRDWLRGRLRNPALTTFVAEQSGAIVGVAECSTHVSNPARPAVHFHGVRPFLRSLIARVTASAPTYIAERRLGAITMIYVTAAVRRDGVGDALAAAMVAELEANEVDEIYLNVFADNPAVGFFESIGMRPESILMRRVGR